MVFIAQLSRRFYYGIALLSCWLLLPACIAQANTHEITSEVDLVGEVRVVSARASDTLMDIARTQNVGHREIRLANPSIDVWLPGQGSAVTIPSQFLLPDAPREGIVLNRSEMRLYYFHADPRTGKRLVSTYPVGIGRADRQTPTASGRITMKLHQPAWYPTKEVRADYAARGKNLDFMVPPGPDNPLGEYAMMLDLPGYIIHGTNRPDGIGMLVSQGCVRLYPEDIKELVERVERGTQVTIVDQTYKLGLVDGQLLIEVHPPVYPRDNPQDAPPSRQLRTMDEGAGIDPLLFWQILHLRHTRGDELRGEINWERVATVAHEANGIPAMVSEAVGGDPVVGLAPDQGKSSD